MKNKYHIEGDTIIVELTQGYKTFVDLADWEYLKEYKWYICISKYTQYAITCIKTDKTIKGWTTVQMHRLILNVLDDMEIDHIDHNGLNNRKNNLRIVTRSQNLQNQKLSINNTSGFKGVSWSKSNHNWQARIMIQRCPIHLGGFINKIDAVKAYNKAAIELHKEFANLNII